MLSAVEYQLTQAAAPVDVVALEPPVNAQPWPYSHDLIPEANGDTSDADRTFSEICARAGFKYEEHQVITDDGYILTVFRIPGLVDETTSSEAAAKPPLFLQHGILDSAYCWIVNYAEVAPAFVAARAGYDVWLGNSRGNTYSKAHVSLDPDHDEAKFWDFDWADMGMYDLPAVIDHIQSQTGGQKVAYIGHSQGTTQMFYGLAEKQEYFADKVPLFVALGPVTMIPNTEADIFVYMADFYDLIADTFSLLGIHQLLGANWFTTTACDLVCTNLPRFCELISALFVTHNPTLDDNDRFAVYMGHEPNGTSVKSILHYAQNMKEARFQEFSDDYTSLIRRHKKRTTPLIPIDTITDVPVAIYPGTADILADMTDAEWTRDTIGDAVVHFEPVLAGHLTFMVGKDMTYFSQSVMPLLQQYHPLPAALE